MTYDKVLDALGDPTRRLIFDRLRENAHSVTALADCLPVSRPAVSQHLKILKEAGLVADEATGTKRIYRAQPNGLLALRAWLDGGKAFAAYQTEIQRQTDERKNT